MLGTFPWTLHMLVYLIFICMLWDKYYYSLQFKDEETEHRESKQSAQQNKVMELRSNPDRLAPATHLNHYRLSCWLIDWINEWMNAKKITFPAKSFISRRINKPGKLIPRAFYLIRSLQFIFHCKVMGYLYLEPSKCWKDTDINCCWWVTGRSWTF